MLLFGLGIVATKWPKGEPDLVGILVRSGSDNHSPPWGLAVGQAPKQFERGFISQNSFNFPLNIAN